VRAARPPELARWGNAALALPTMVWRYRQFRINKTARGLVHSRYAAKVELVWQFSAAGGTMLSRSCRCQNALACFLQGTSKLNIAVASADTPVAVRASSVSSLTPSGIEKRHRAVAASPTRFFELLVDLLCQQSH